MDQSYRSSTFAGNNKRICRVVIVAPAYSTLNLIRGGILNILDAFDLESFSKLLIVQFGFRHLKFLTAEVLDSEPNSSQFNGIKLLDLVVILSTLIFQ